MTNLEKRLGQRIARQRKAVGFTQAQLAERVAVEPETISRIETGTRVPSLDLIALIGEALGVDLHELFRLHDPDDPRHRAVERLSWFVARLSPAEIELVMNVGAAVLKFARQGAPRPPAKDSSSSGTSDSAEGRIGS